MKAVPPPVLQPQTGPKTPPPEGLASAVVGRSVAAHARLAGARVLVVEDDDDARELICALLEMAGAKCLCVESVAQAMDGIYHSFDPDVVLTDFSMPDANGLDLIRQFRQVPSARAVPIPILVLSGHSGEGWRAKALEAGAVELITKPFEPTLLITRIAAAIAPGRSGPH